MKRKTETQKGQKVLFVRMKTCDCLTEGHSHKSCSYRLTDIFECNTLKVPVSVLLLLTPDSCGNKDHLQKQTDPEKAHSPFMRKKTAQAIWSEKILNGGKKTYYCITVEVLLSSCLTVFITFLCVNDHFIKQLFLPTVTTTVSASASDGVFKLAAIKTADCEINYKRWNVFMYLIF